MVIVLLQCTEVRFASFFSGGLITMTEINPPERKLAKRTFVQCTGKDMAKRTSVHCSSTMTITHLYKTPYHTKLERIETAYDGRKEGALPGARLAPPAPSEVSRYS